MGVYYFDNPAQERDLYEEIYNRQVKYKQTRGIGHAWTRKC